MKREAKYLLDKAVNSLVLSVELFNRPWDKGRPDAVLILLDHAFEMLLKASILHKGGKIRQANAKETIGFDHCVRKSYSDAAIKFLSEEQVLLLQSINSMRDSAQHHLVDISEPHLYILAQSGLTLFCDIYENVFGEKVRKALPERVLPLATAPPQELTALFESEVEQVKRLLQPGARRGIEAEAKIRALAIMESAIEGERLQPSLTELRKIKRRILSGESWDKIFPGVAMINTTQKGYGPSIDLRITKNEGISIHVANADDRSAYPIGIKRVTELDYYSMGLNDLAAKLGISPPKAVALIRAMKLQDDEKYYKNIKIGKSAHGRYSKNALDFLKKQIEDNPNIIEESWVAHKPKPAKRGRFKR